MGLFMRGVTRKMKMKGLWALNPLVGRVIEEEMEGFCGFFSYSYK